MDVFLSLRLHNYAMVIQGMKWDSLKVCLDLYVCI